jgi:purine-binding chemotaxis protein CheW
MEAEQHLVFRVAGAGYAIAVRHVREIVEAGAITRVPAAPTCVRGVTNLRGTVLPVVDLAVKFGLAECTITRWTCVIVLELEHHGESTLLGILADAVSDVMSFGPDVMATPPEFGTGVNASYLKALAKVADEFVLVLDVARLLAPDELAGTVPLPPVAEPVAAPGAPRMGTGPSDAR